MNLAPDLEELRKLPEFLTEGKTIGPAEVRERPRMDDTDKLLASVKQMEREMRPPPKPVKIDPLDEIARLVRALTYGEMMEFAEGLWKAKDGEGLYGGALAPTFHKWSVSHVSQ